MGLFDRFVISDPRGSVRTFCVYMRFYGGQGDANLTISVIDPEGEVTTVADESPLQLVPNGIIEGISRVQGMRFTEQGSYQFIVLSNGEQIGNAARVAITIIEREQLDEQ